ncbi:MAG: zinc-binding dehydrogenase [Bacteroidota bacterium]
MKAILLVRHGKAQDAFAIRELPLPVPGPAQVLIRTEASGLNFADVMSRLGLYRDAPPLPFVPGYEAVGRVEACGSEVRHVKKGDRVLAFTRFGAYAEYVCTDARAAVSIPEDMPAGAAAALGTQYCTAWYAAEEALRLHEGEHVLVNAAAGGVGIALVQLAKRRKCIVYGACGSDEKIAFLKELGVDHPLNYDKEDLYDAIRKIRGKRGLDVVFDSVGGSNFKKGYRLLGPGGRMVSYGAAERVNSKKLFATLRLAWNFGFFSPIPLLMRSQALIGVNLLRIADHKPELLRRCLGQVVELTLSGELKPHVGGVFPYRQVAEAHTFFESRKSMGKLIITW